MELGSYDVLDVDNEHRGWHHLQNVPKTCQ